MPIRKYEVKLLPEERSQLLDTVKNGVSSAKTILRANILLLLDTNNKERRTVFEIANELNTSPTTVQNVKNSYCENGMDSTLYRKKRDTPPIEPKITGEVEAKVIALACTQPPEGRVRWTLRLLADKAMELEYIDSISYVSVGDILKKTNLSLTERSAGISQKDRTQHL